ncbi:c-type cytochrome domain-containing protein [Maribacter thermophilus]|uniref:c-type cytochrome domain-containing protein n=1 Tax=Maribacter thermophilus TaxID=1197874 RepID=UPI000640DE0E|nr:c-type cytochrome domain-containing protein [Maribacter thermophilus]
MHVLKELLGRLHPLIVHLPIGFIIIGLILQVYDRKLKEHNKVISLIYLWAGYFAILACITGYLQYLGEGYSFDSVKLHLWSGIVTALFCFLMWAKLKDALKTTLISKTPLVVLSMLFFALISFTGHQGGNITHGEDYLVEPLPNSIKSALGYEVFEEKEIVLTDENWETAVLYTDVVQPILNNHCVSCHNPKKAKGELLLNTKEGILKSGENAPVIMANHPDKSDLFTRMELPKEDDKHMPPDGKTQPSKEAIKLIGVWIENGLSFDQTIGELGLEKSLFQSFFPKTTKTDYPGTAITAAVQDSIKKVKNIGLHLDPISESTNYLKVSALNFPGFTDTNFQTLKSIAPQIAILDLGGTQVTDAIIKDLATLPNLTILKIDNTDITGEHIDLLKSLEHLRSINLSNTNFKKENLDKLKGFTSLESVYLFNPSLEKTGTELLNEGRTIIEYGNYNLPPLKTDSIIY